MDVADGARVVAWRGIAVRIQGNPSLLDLLDQHVPPFFGGSGTVIAEARLLQDGNHLTVELPDGLSVSGLVDTETLRACASRIELLIAAQLPDRVAVHAGVVAWEGRAIVVPGMSMTGKSTLVRALVERGATYLTDEFALLDEQGLVWPYPRRMTMRTATGTERRQPDGSADVAGPGVPVALVVYVTFSPDGWVVEPASKGQAVMALAANALPIKHAPARTLDCLTAASQSAVGLRGTRGEADDAVDHLLALL